MCQRTGPAAGHAGHGLQLVLARTSLSPAQSSFGLRKASSTSSAAKPPLAAATTAAAPSSPPTRAAGGGEIEGVSDALRRAWTFLWDPAEPSLRIRIGASFALMIGAKLTTIQVPFLFKHAIDALTEQ